VAAGVLATALPALAILRIGRIVLDRGRHAGRAIQALPWIVILSLCWAIGEALGYLAGPGDSLDRWR
jgi:hypothetical protein